MQTIKWTKCIPVAEYAGLVWFSFFDLWHINFGGLFKANSLFVEEQ